MLYSNHIYILLLWFGHRILTHKTKLYGRNYVCISAIFAWNYLQNLHRNILFHKLTKNILKKLRTLPFLGKYVFQISVIIYLILHLLSWRFQTFCSIKASVKFYFRGDCTGLHKIFLGYHGGVWKFYINF